MTQPTGMIFDIQHFTLHDGPGVRSTIFFKGCPLACWWCSNPESQASSPQLLYFRHLCTMCGGCAGACPQQALSLTAEGLVMDRGACDACGACAAACCQDARQLSGRRMTVAEVCEEVRQHWRIFEQSGGGVTCSGGEALAQPEFALAVFRTLHETIGLSTCLDTCGLAPWPVVERMLPYVDLVLYDIKHMDSRKHKNATRAGNEVILANARKLAESGTPVLVRVPLIPGFNDTDENMTALASFMHEAGLSGAEIMPYHTLGMNKHAALGMEYGYRPDTKPRINESAAILEARGISVLVHEN